MERLTTRDGHGIPELKGISESQRLCPKDRVLILDSVDRLTAYEDTGLGPDSVNTLKEKFRQLYHTFDECCPDDPVHFQGLLDKLKGWREAERDGRLVVLPCKVGDTVYRIIDDCTLPGDCGTRMKCKGCDYRNLFVEPEAFSLSLLCNNGTLKTGYYLTRQEAEAALRKGEK